MKVVPVSPSGQPLASAPAETQGLTPSKLDQIKAKLASTMQPKAEAPKPQEHPVPDANKVAPEDLSAIKPPAQASDSNGEIPQPDTSESPQTTPEAPKATEESNPLSAQYAQLARKEKAMRLEAQRLKSERQAFQAERDALKTPPPALYDSNKHLDRQRLLEDPLNTLAELGLSYDQLTQAQLNAPSQEQMALQRTIKSLEAKIASLEDGQTGTKKMFEEQQANSYKQAVSQLTKEASQLVFTDPNFETIKATNNVKEVIKLIEDTWKEEGSLMSVEQACEEVENYLAEEAYKLSQLSKIQKRLKPAAAPASTPAKPADGSSPQKTQTTLTNTMTTSRQYSQKERAILAAQHGPNWRSKVS